MSIKIEIMGHFINKHQGGWRDIPKDLHQRACTMVFLDVDSLEMEQHWSLIINIEVYNFDAGKFRGKAHFLAETLPDNFVREGRTIELYEGPRFIGYGLIMSVMNQPTFAASDA